MTYKGSSIQCLVDREGIAQLKFNNEATGTNVFNAATLKELGECLNALKKETGVKGLIMSSGLENFIFGADVTEFMSHFKRPEAELISWLEGINKIFNQYEDLPYPSVAAINGFALGGGFEIALTADYRVVSESARIGLPETQLGIMPGWGGTVRLSRISGADHAIEWITSGKQYKGTDGLRIGVVDAVVKNEKLVTNATTLLKRAIAGELDWKKKREQKKAALKLNQVESMMAFESAKGFVAKAAGANYPAPVMAVQTMQKGGPLNRDEALKIETVNFVKLTKTSAAEALVTVFLGDQYLKKVSKKLTKTAPKVKHAAVIGAGIMGGGIAYQSASKGTPILMKDIRSEALELGMGEAVKLLGKLVERKTIDNTQMAKVIASITPTLSYGDVEYTDLIVEAVVENIKVKKSVLVELESKVKEGTVITSNTSTISITELARELKRPQDFCGMHFFNPVHKMPLVEVIRGAKTSDETVARTVAYALQMGKTPIVVNDCAGFLVNRILFPYFFGFNKLIEDGVDFKRIDQVMEKFGWPMGPAYLLDVVGIDTCVHAAKIMADAYPDRMKYEGDNIYDWMFKENRYGQKNGKGFYEYTVDKKGKPIKNLNPEVYTLIKKAVKKPVEISDEEIVERMMLPMIIESARCLEDKIVGSAIEVDMGLLLGLGFPPFRTGALKYADVLGFDKIVALSNKYQNLGNAYKVTSTMSKMASDKKTYY
ncbi:MAG: fatty acid oxidation complex subunit alpha FadB [Bdellovibrio sp.]|nr:fatty acid oxidation complex subunit alpha FadB [Bdellovibrio sp.]